MNLPMYRRFYLVSCATAIMLIIIFVAQISSAQEPLARSPKSSAIAKLERGAKELAAAVAMPVAIGDKLRTMKNAQVSVTFRDGSSAELGESSYLTIDRYALSGSTAHLRTARVMGRTSAHHRQGGDRPRAELRGPHAQRGRRGARHRFRNRIHRQSPLPRGSQLYALHDGRSLQGHRRGQQSWNPAPPTEVREGYETTVACESAATSPAPLGMEDLGAPGYH